MGIENLGMKVTLSLKMWLNIYMLFIAGICKYADASSHSEMEHSER